jgi:hypothetical protein
VIELNDVANLWFGAHGLAPPPVEARLCRERVEHGAGIGMDPDFMTHDFHWFLLLRGIDLLFATICVDRQWAVDADRRIGRDGEWVGGRIVVHLSRNGLGSAPSRCPVPPKKFGGRRD